MADRNTNVVTSDNIASMNAAMKKIKPLLDQLKTKGAKVEYFKDQYETLNAKYSTLEAAIANHKREVGTADRKTADDTFKKITELGKTAQQETKKNPVFEYWYGPTKVPSEAALVAKVQKDLPTADRPHAKAAIAGAVSGGAQVKDASAIGSDVKHSSAGVAATKTSCTIFFTLTEENKGLRTLFKIVGVGGHASKGGTSSYNVHASFAPYTGKLKPGSVVSV